MGAIILAVVIAIFWYSISSNGGKKISKRTFRSRATSIGLTKNQTRLLESFMEKVRDPASLLANTGELNRTLAEALRNCSDAQDPITKKRQLEIYKIKQRIDKVFANSMTSSRQLRINQKLTFQQENGERFASWITANLKAFYCAGIPKNLEGELIRWRKGSKIKQFILSIDDEEIVFESKVLGYTNIINVPSVILGHTVRKKRSLIREHRRRSISGRVVLYPLRSDRIIEKGRKSAKEMFIANKLGLTGTLVNLSPGGCSISSRSILDLGELVKLIFEYKAGRSVVAFGKIVNIHAINRIKNIIHVKFTEMSIGNMNLINSYVYNLC